MKKYKYIYVEITNVCNLNCSFCPPTTRIKRFMSVDDINIIIKNIKNRTDNVYLHVKGEPLLHPQLNEIFELFNENNISVNITTNGTLIAKNQKILLNAKNIKRINFSLQSMENNDITEQKQYIEDIINFIKIIIPLKKTACTLRIWNIDDINLSKNAVIQSILNEFNVNAEILNKKNNFMITDFLHINIQDKFEWPDISSENTDENGYCYALKDQLAILSDGTVTACCLDHNGIINLGNIFEQSLNEIQQSERFNDISIGFSRNLAVEELCKHCTYKQRLKKNRVKNT